MPSSSLLQPSVGLLLAFSPARPHPLCSALCISHIGPPEFLHIMTFISRGSAARSCLGARFPPFAFLLGLPSDRHFALCFFHRCMDIFSFLPSVCAPLVRLPLHLSFIHTRFFFLGFRFTLASFAFLLVAFSLVRLAARHICFTCMHATLLPARPPAPRYLFALPRLS